VRRGPGPAAASLLAPLVGLALAAASPVRGQSPPPPIADSTVVVADSAAVAADSAAVELPPPFRRSPTIRSLETFRLERSVDVRRFDFGDPEDPTEPPGALSLADVLRLDSEIRTRELSQGPTVETFGIQGGGSGRADLRGGSGSLVTPGTSGPFGHEVALSELRGFDVLRGGGAALYGPTALSGAVVLDPRFPEPEGLVTRAVAEEGVDDYQRGAFQVARPLGTRGSLFLNTESRRVDGFFPGTKEVDRHFAGEVRGRLPGGWEGSFGYRRWEGDGRSGGFDPDLEDRSVLTKRGDWRASIFRPSGEERGALLELGLLRQRLENVGLADRLTREYVSPSARLTADLPQVAGWELVTRLETRRWRVAREEEATVDRFWRGGGAVRATRSLGTAARITATGRTDLEQDRRRALHVRLEGEWMRGPVSAFAVGSRGERIPERGAAGSANEVANAFEAGLVARFGGARARAALFASRIHDFRRDPTFEEVQAREAVLDAPIGTAEIGSGSVSLATGPFRLPGLASLGELELESGFTVQRAELAETGEDLPGRPRRVWTGQGTLERFFFRDELRARVRGKLTHWGDRGGGSLFGLEAIDVWLTDVQLEGEIGDAIFFYRFHDLLERADDPEPGYRFPGFSRVYGISWRFIG
jgi:outer membrane receptor protein involved in Fe transport